MPGSERMSRASVPPRSGDVVPILLYHRVATAASALLEGFTVSPPVFGQHLDALQASGYAVVSMRQLFEHRDRGSSIAGLVGLTIDDGYADTVHVAEELARRGMNATAFVTTGWLVDGPPHCLRRNGGDPQLSHADVRRIADLGIEIGAHSESHPEFDMLEAADLAHELLAPKRYLEELVGGPVDGVAWPFGHADVGVRRAAAEAGYHYGVGVNQRLSAWPLDPFRIDRLVVKPDTSVATVLRWAAGGARSPLSRDTVVRVGWRQTRRAMRRVGVER
jgi:peptidoglycan/xylan/chitin deacetylase (PgdA/CDA1 family)